MYKHSNYMSPVKGEKPTSLMGKAELNTSVHLVSKLAVVPMYGRESSLISLFRLSRIKKEIIKKYGQKLSFSQFVLLCKFDN